MGEKNKTERKKYFQKHFGEFPEAVRNKLVSISAMFLFGGVVMLFIFLKMGMMDIWYFPLIVIGYGVYLVVQLYYLASNNKLQEVEGVVIGTDRDGYRRQNHYLILQTPRGNVYKVFAVDKSSHYKEGDIVRFYTIRSALTHLKDGVFEVRVVYAIERVSAKVTTDEEDEKILSQEDFVTEEENNQGT